MKEPIQEPWDLKAFLRHFNAKAKRSGVVPARPNIDEGELRNRYEKGVIRPWLTVREFAEAEVLLYSRD